MFCEKCGREIEQEARFCGKCGAPVKRYTEVASSSSSENRKHAQEKTSKSGNWLLAEYKCVPSFALGLIAGILGICGGYCVTACTGLLDGGNRGFFLILLPSIIGLIGGCLCFKHARLGSLMELIPAVTIAYCGWFTSYGADFMSILAMLLFLVGGVVGLIATRSAK